MSTGGKVCAETASVERKSLTPSEKRIHYTPAPGETFSQLPIRTNFIPVLPSCEKWQLVGRLPNSNRLSCSSRHLKGPYLTYFLHLQSLPPAPPEPPPRGSLTCGTLNMLLFHGSMMM